MDDIDYKDCITLEHAESDEEEHEGYCKSSFCRIVIDKTCVRYLS